MFTDKEEIRTFKHDSFFFFVFFVLFFLLCVGLRVNVRIAWCSEADTEILLREEGVQHE